MENVPPATRERVDETRALFCMNFYEISRHKTRDSPIGTRVHRVPVTGHKFHSLALVALEIKLDCLKKKKKREKEKMRKREGEIRRKSYTRCPAEVMEGGFCDFGWSKKFGWNIYVCAFQRQQ